ncbi:major urinary protein 4-like isoform X1 [Ochotona curzoniae]|uniref:major urinary protein 4-like isoform X1 n=1 Tax=Ochotona curzoniae TaxID=130825 RepID=UPI001B34CC7F|nr:major urinary protein 4-like isoform X1 [Ochotona curzoniae]
MKMLWLCVALALVGAQKEAAADVSEISGEWYSILLSSDDREKIEENGSMRVFARRIDVLEDSSLSVKFHAIVNGECVAHELVADPTEEEGVYTVEYDGHNVFHIIDADPDEYVIFYVKNDNNGEGYQLIHLLGREPDVSSEIREKFVQLSQEHGIVKENILDLTKTDRCLQARDQA